MFDSMFARLCAMLVMLLALCQPVTADAGDVFAGIFGTLIGLVAVCACLGVYARRKQSTDSGV
ncbi:MAG: hypothetical protein MHM6MM_008682 [Cercozoa sp. M6MM]